MLKCKIALQTILFIYFGVFLSHFANKFPIIIVHVLHGERIRAPVRIETKNVFYDTAEKGIDIISNCVIKLKFHVCCVFCLPAWLPDSVCVCLFIFVADFKGAEIQARRHDVNVTNIARKNQKKKETGKLL